MALDLPPVEDPIVALQLVSDSHLGTHIGSASGAVWQYTTELTTRFFLLVNISAVIAAVIFKRLETDSGLT